VPLAACPWIFLLGLLSVAAASAARVSLLASSRGVPPPWSSCGMVSEQEVEKRLGIDVMIVGMRCQGDRM